MIRRDKAERWGEIEIQGEERRGKSTAYSWVAMLRVDEKGGRGVCCWQNQVRSRDNVEEQDSLHSVNVWVQVSFVSNHVC